MRTGHVLINSRPIPRDVAVIGPGFLGPDVAAARDAIHRGGVR